MQTVFSPVHWNGINLKSPKLTLNEYKCCRKESFFESAVFWWSHKLEAQHQLLSLPSVQLEQLPETQRIKKKIWRKLLYVVLVGDSIQRNSLKGTRFQNLTGQFNGNTWLTCKVFTKHTKWSEIQKEVLKSICVYVLGIDVHNEIYQHISCGNIQIHLQYIQYVIIVTALLLMLGYSIMISHSVSLCYWHSMIYCHVFMTMCHSVTDCFRLT